MSSSIIKKMSTLKIIFIFLYVISCYFQAHGADKYTDENRPYEFGFTIEGEQHRHEKKDENGIIIGEFGFITADGVYHVTVYATDENGNFKIISMKNIRVKPYPTAPGTSANQGSVTPYKQSQSFNKQGSTEHAVPSAGARQGHSIPLSVSQEASSKPSLNEIPHIKPENDGPARSCSHCSVPTTTTAVPKFVTKTENEQLSQNNYAQSELGISNPYGKNLFSSQQPRQNYPSLGSVYTQQAHSNPDKSEANQPIYENQYSVRGNEQFNQVNRAKTSNEEQQYQHTYFQNTGEDQSYVQNLNPKQENTQNLSPGQTFSVGNSNVQNSQNGQTYPQEYNVPNNKKAPGIPTNNLQNPNSGLTNSLNNQKNANLPNYNNGEQIAQQPQSNIDGYRHPKSFNDVLQSANPDQFSNTNEAGPEKPILIAAQMELVDKNTDIYHKKPGEKDGLPKGLNKNDMTQLLYTFNYTVGFHGHHEEGYSSGAKIGYYFVTGRNGIRTRVDYVADENGFRPRITQEVLDILSDEVPKPETERDEKYGLKGYEFKWLYYPVESRRR
ncbi:unnamed protein product, partial [Brenthis ino]